MNRNAAGRIIVGLDRDPTDDAVLTAALVEASYRNAGLVVVHAVEITGQDLDTVDAGGIRERRAAQTRRIAAARTEMERHVGKHLAEQGLDVIVTYQVQCGDPATCLLSAGQEADLIVVGTSGPTHRSPMVLGLVSQDVSVHARCPVLLVPTRAI